MARIRAPELSGAGGWIGTTEPLSLSTLAGKIVVLDFWTSCCINCMRVLDELRPIEERFADEVVVVGLHSPKFPREHEHAAVVQAVARLGITHPVLDDPDLTTWAQYGVRGWPTLVVIDPEGYIVGGVSGEGCGPLIVQTIEGLIATHDASGTLVRGPLPTLVALPSVPPSLRALSYPGKVATDPTGQRLVVADTGHDRIIVCDVRGRVERTFAGLHAPQGVRVDADHLVVCDTGADRLVAISLSTGAHQVIAADLAAPWDVIVDGDGYLVAEAGRHRLWRVGRDGTTNVAAGTGEENLVDGPAPTALLAQPSALARMPGREAVAFLDAESSALRVLTDDGEVRTLVGQDLFEWGASDGGIASAALQHPLGVAAAPDGTLYVADTFNSLLRAWEGPSLSATDGSVRTLPVAGLEEPGGLDLLADGRLVVADTNHHRVVLVNPHTGDVEPVVIDESWEGTAAGTTLSSTEGAVIAIPYEARARPEAATLTLDFSAGPPVRVEVNAEPASLLGPGPRRLEVDDERGVLELPAGRAGTGIVIVEVTVNLCDDLQCTVVHEKTRHDLSVSAPPAVEG